MTENKDYQKFNNRLTLKTSLFLEIWREWIP